MAPPVTPSPHRFMIKKELSGNVPAASQFNTTPRFSLTPAYQPKSSNKIPNFVLNSSHFQASTANKSFRNDVIEIESDRSSDSGESLNEERYVEIRSEDKKESQKNGEPASKRRKKPISVRLLDKQVKLGGETDQDSEELNGALSLPEISTPSSARPKRLDHIRQPRFLVSSPDPMFTSRDLKETLVFAKPPRFRPPDPNSLPDPNSDPDPDQFSPHRRGEKYIMGGLAAELRSWLVNIKSSISSPSTGEKDSWLVKILVEDFNGSSTTGVTLVRGKKIISLEVGKKEITDEVKLILTRESSGIFIQQSDNIEKGKTIGIRGPIWEVIIKNEKWIVGVDWKVI